MFFIFFSYRDLKPENILCIKTNGSITLKLADFGLGKLLTEKSQEKLYASSLVGTFTYLPPEIIKGIWTNKPSAYGPYCDIWSLGCVTMFMCLRAVDMFSSAWEVMQWSGLGTNLCPVHKR